MNDRVALSDITAAASRIASLVRRTPVLSSPELDACFGAHLLFKCESLQHGGAFKLRGASNAVLCLRESGALRAVVTHSSGNHGAALARAAAHVGIAAHVVVPEGASAVKLALIEAAGATIHRCAATLAAREASAAQIQAETGAVMVHPYTDLRVIAGQGTAALELLDQAGSLDAYIAPIGGGGLISGSAVALRALSPNTEILGAEPMGADDAFRSLEAGQRVEVVPETICDGLRALIGPVNFDLIRQHGVQVVRVDDAAVLAAMAEIESMLGLRVEPSSAITLAALWTQRERFAGRRIGVLLSGGNRA